MKAILVTEMPENCTGCFLCVYSNNDGCCLAMEERRTGRLEHGQKPDWCPLVPMPEKRMELGKGNKGDREIKIELKKCPFCGADVAEILDAHDLEECANFEDDSCPCNQYEDAGGCPFHTVVCSMDKGGCGASSGYFETEEMAAQAWNNRD